MKNETKLLRVKSCRNGTQMCGAHCWLYNGIGYCQATGKTAKPETCDVSFVENVELTLEEYAVVSNMIENSAHH